MLKVIRLALFIFILILLNNCEEQGEKYSVSGTVKYFNTDSYIPNLVIKCDENYTLSDSLGQFIFDEIGHGSRDISIESTTFDEYQQSINVNNDIDSMSIEVRSRNENGFKINGQVTTYLGNPIKDARVSLLSGDSTQAILYTYSDVSGNYSLPNFLQGQYVLSCESNYFEPAYQAVLTFASELNVDLLFSSSSVPEAPTNLSLEPISTGAIKIIWQPVTNPTIIGYNIFRAEKPYPSSQVEYSLIAEHVPYNSIGYVDRSGLIVSKNYEYKIAAVTYDLKDGFLSTAKDTATRDLFSDIVKLDILGEYNYSAIDAQDFNDDDIVDLLVGYQNRYKIFYGEGASGERRWVEGYVFSIHGDFYQYPSIKDIDDDGDFDIISGSPSGYIHFYENIGSAISPDFIINTSWATGIVQDTTINGYHYSHAAPTFEDFDGDGDYDLFISYGYNNSFPSSQGGIAEYENVGSQNAPQWSLYAPLPYVDNYPVWPVIPGAARVRFVDINNDGLFDSFTAGNWEWASRDDFIFSLVHCAIMRNSICSADSTDGITPNSDECSNFDSPLIRQFMDMDVGLLNIAFADADNDNDYDMFITFGRAASGDYGIYYAENNTESDWQSIICEE